METLVILPIFLLGGVVAILATAFWIWMLVDCALHEPSEGNDKLVWVAIILCTHVLGAILYYFARRSKRLRASGTG